MKLVGLMPVRNEDWILGFGARVALQWCDELVLFMHACEDDSSRIVQNLRSDYGDARVHYLDGIHYHSGPVDATDRNWHEMAHRQALLEHARSWNATHIALIDADEVLTANLVPHVRSWVEGTPRGSILQLPLYNLRGGVDRYHANGVWGNRIVSVAFADMPELHWSGDRFHSREPDGRRLTGFRPAGQDDGGVLHFWGASERRLHEKHRLYRVTERLRWPGKDVKLIERTYSMAEKGMSWVGDTPGTWVYRGVDPAWYAGYEDLMAKHLHVDAEPWQKAECDRLIAEHGREMFEGLELFGVDGDVRQEERRAMFKGRK